MVQKKKLQVFVSSTYSDLLEERQAAVQAILTAGHIPAGMELFAAGNESQLNVIKQWIDDSDVFLLILGGRYGSIEPESGKSYIQLEYEYALEQEKPTFAVVITEEYLNEKVQKNGIDFIERESTEKLKEFRGYVLTKLVEFWNDPRDIQLTVLKKMGELERREDLVGWVRGDQAVSGQVTEELARLIKENSELRQQNEESYNGLTFDQIYDLLSDENIELDSLHVDLGNLIQQTAEAFGDYRCSLIHLFWLMRENLKNIWEKLPAGHLNQLLAKLQSFGLVDYVPPRSGTRMRGWSLTIHGRQFLSRLTRERANENANDLVLPYEFRFG